MSSTGVRLPSASSRRLVEEYILRVAPQMRDEFGFATLVPWESEQRQRPGNVISADSSRRHWSAEEVTALVSRFSTLLVPCTFETQHERRVVRELLTQLQPRSDVSVLMLQLLEVPGEPSRHYVSTVMARHEALLSVGSQAVILEPDSDPVRLRHQLDQEREWFEANARRANSMISHDNEHLQSVVEHHHELLWESTPRALMPRFAPVDRDLVEQTNMVGGYTLVHRFRTVEGKVLQATKDDQEAVIKVYDKSTYVSAGDLECIYREFRLLTNILAHPHIIRCHGMLHSLSRVYLIFEFGGMQNLQLRLLDQPGYRLELEDAMACVMQIGDALAFCHSQDVVHRQVSLEHIVMEDDLDRPCCRLVDFLSATRCPPTQRSATACGDLPCIAPEVAVEELYFPRPADCWSLGVVLLEAAGGLGSLMRAAGWNEDTEPRRAAADIRDLFSREGNHARALASVGGVRSGRALAVLQALLRPVPADRATMQAVLDQQRAQSTA